MARRSGWTIGALADAYLTGGARFLQVRAKSAPSGAFLHACEAVVARGRSAEAIIIVNDRADLAALSQAAGVHLGQTDLDPVSARRIVGASALVGLSTHSIGQVRAAAALPVDYIAVGPLFGTATKDTGYANVGTALLSEARRLLDEMGVGLPLVAIGGMTLERAPEAIRAGAASVAVISDLLSTGNPADRVREYLGVLGPLVPRE